MFTCSSLTNPGGGSVISLPLASYLRIFEEALSSLFTSFPKPSLDGRVMTPGLVVVAVVVVVVVVVVEPEAALLSPPPPPK
jgi:hypothetical protein